jgi:hypothetical protein
MWNEVDGNAHILVAGHWGAEVEVGNVTTHHTGSRCGDGAVDDQFCCGGIGGWRAYIAWVFDEVTTNSEASALRFCFLWAVGANDTTVGDIVAPFLRDPIICSEVDGIGWCL